MDLQRAVSYTESALGTCREPYGPLAYEAAILADLAFYREILDMLRDSDGDPATCRNAALRVAGFTHARLGRVAKDCDPAKQELAKKLRDEAKGLFGKVKGSVFMRPVDEIAAEVRETARFVRTLVALVRDLDYRFTAKSTEAESISRTLRGIVSTSWSRTSAAWQPRSGRATTSS